MSKPTSVEKIGEISNSSLLKYTKKDWNFWLQTLEAEGARHLSHKQITLLLKRKFRLSVWWQHQVASGFEIHTGKKLAGRNAKGLFSATATKTFLLGAKKVWEYLISEEGLALWLSPLTPFEVKPGRAFEISGGIFGEVRTVMRGKRIRLMWQDMEWEKPTYLQIQVVGRGTNKTMVVLQHEGIATAAAKKELHQRWRKALDELSTKFTLENLV